MANSKDQHVLFLMSTDSQNIWTGNKPYDFTCELPEKLRLKGRWACALYSMVFQERVSASLTILCDICESSVIKSEKHSILQVVPNNIGRQIYFYNLLWFDVTFDKVERVRLFIKTSNLQDASFLTKPVSCTLVLKRIV